MATFSGTNGANPSVPLVQGTDGNFYGTTEIGGTNGDGTVFKVTPTGTLTTLHSFDATDGASPLGLVLGLDGNFYGTTGSGGSNGDGTVFKITPAGTLTTLHSFAGTDGAVPNGGLVQTADGNFHGTTSYGGAHNSCQSGCGTVFTISPSGTLTTLYNFCSQGNCVDGANPSAGLVQGTDGNFYGTTSIGGTSTRRCSGGGPGCGTVFRITPGGALLTLYSFCSQQNCTDGTAPGGGALVQALDGNFYGTASGGGATFNGTVFKITPGGALTTLYSFCSQTNCTDGSLPAAGVVQATDENLYGTTLFGGAVSSGCDLGCGTIFEITTAGTFNTLHSFDIADGNRPLAGLLQATDGNFYGTTYSGGTSGSCQGDGCGTVFKLSNDLIPFLETQPTSGPVGTPVTILGTNLSGATNVFFNGTPASFQVVSSSEITTTVPAGATTGIVQVAVPGSTTITKTDFQVTGPLQFNPVTPCRLVDTRQGNPIQGGQTANFIIPGLGNCGIPASAAAYSLNVTVVPHGPLGYLTIWPLGEIQPYVSTMNSFDGRIKANAAIVPSGNNGVSVYVTNTTDVILDIDGYFTPPGSGTYQFYSMTPCRIIDTRNGQDGGTLQAGHERDYPLATYNPNCTIPSSATAYSLNITVVPPTGLDYLTVWPQGQTKPNVSTLNDYTGTVVANAAIVPAGSNNTTAFWPNSNNTDLVVDVNGYFGPAGGLNLYAMAPCRVLDTRTAGGAFSGTLSPPVNVVGSPCAPPSTAQSFVFNATVVPNGFLDYLTLWADVPQQPYVSTLNAWDGYTTSNMAIVPTTNGLVNAFAYNPTQLILDISGYFAP